VKEIEKIRVLYSFINDYIWEMEEDVSFGTGYSFPEFDLYARDYLEFAENQIRLNTIESRINCISNLKRAVDCQIDTFLFTLSLNRVIKKKNLSFKNKLEFIDAIGVCNSNSLIKLNTIRNRIEHEYKVLEVRELDLYFDLVSTFISNLESAITILAFGERNFYTNDSNGKVSRYFTLSLERGNEPKIIATWDHTPEKGIEVSFDEYKAFVFYLRCLYLLCIRNAFGSNKYVKDRIEELYNKLSVVSSA